MQAQRVKPPVEVRYLVRARAARRCSVCVSVCSRDGRAREAVIAGIGAAHQVVALDEYNCNFILSNTDASIANALRKTIISEVPTICIDLVEIEESERPSCAPPPRAAPCRPLPCAATYLLAPVLRSMAARLLDSARVLTRRRWVHARVRGQLCKRARRPARAPAAPALHHASSCHRAGFVMCCAPLFLPASWHRFIVLSRRVHSTPPRPHSVAVPSRDHRGPMRVPVRARPCRRALSIPTATTLLRHTPHSPPPHDTLSSATRHTLLRDTPARHTPQTPPCLHLRRRDACAGRIAVRVHWCALTCILS